jgi:hypothetical protein
MVLSSGVTLLDYPVMHVVCLVSPARPCPWLLAIATRGCTLFFLPTPTIHKK